MRFRVAVLTVLLSCPAVHAGQVLYSPEGNRLRRYDIDTIKQPPLLDDVFIERASGDPVRGRDINGMVCLLPDGSGRFIAGEDTGQPTIPPGWGVFDSTGTQVGKLAATYNVDPGDPFGCAFDAQGRLFTTEIGNNSGFEPFNGQLIVWFPPFDRFPGAPGTYPNTEHSTNFCKIASDIGLATSIAVDEQGRVYVTGARSGVLRYSPPFPTSPDAAGGCGRTDSLGSPLANAVNVETFINDPTNVFTPTGLARAANGNWYVASVFTGIIAQYDPNGVFVRRVLAGSTPPSPTGHPQGLAVDADGDLYYADLALVIRPGEGIGPDSTQGKVWRIAFDVNGDPQPPAIIKEGLAFPDALGILPGDLEHPPCPGDCDQSRVVSIAELVRGVNITLGRLDIDQCALFDGDGNRRASIDELIAGVDAAVHGCPGGGP